MNIKSAPKSRTIREENKSAFTRHLFILIWCSHLSPSSAWFIGKKTRKTTSCWVVLRSFTISLSHGMPFLDHPWHLRIHINIHINHKVVLPPSLMWTLVNKNPMNTIVISMINPSYWSYVHQLNAIPNWGTTLQAQGCDQKWLSFSPWKHVTSCKPSYNHLTPESLGFPDLHHVGLLAFRGHGNRFLGKSMENLWSFLSK